MYKWKKELDNKLIAIESCNKGGKKYYTISVNDLILNSNIMLNINYDIYKNLALKFGGLLLEQSKELPTKKQVIFFSTFDDIYNFIDTIIIPKILLEYLKGGSS